MALDDNSKFLEEKPCMACDSKQRTVVYRFAEQLFPHDRFETASWDGRQNVSMQIVRCDECGLVYSNPSFKEEYLPLIYPEDLFDKENLAQNLDSIFRLDNRKFNKLLRLVRRFVEPGKVLLDLGSRYGVCPYIAEKRYGYRAYGMEFNPALVEVGRVRFPNLLQGTTADLPCIAEENQLDRLNAVTMDDLLEHLMDPCRDLKTIARYQEPGDHLFLRQMDFDSIGRKLYGQKWYYFQPAAHITYLTEATLEPMLKRSGYEIEHVQRCPSLLNYAITSFFITPKRWLRRAFSPLRRSKDLTKPSYLVTRNRSYDDMFTIVAKRV